MGIDVQYNNKYNFIKEVGMKVYSELQILKEKCVFFVCLTSGDLSLPGSACLKRSSSPGCSSHGW